MVKNSINNQWRGFHDSNLFTYTKFTHIISSIFRFLELRCNIWMDWTGSSMCDVLDLCWTVYLTSNEERKGIIQEIKGISLCGLKQNRDKGEKRNHGYIYLLLTCNYTRNSGIAGINNEYALNSITKFWQNRHPEVVTPIHFMKLNIKYLQYPLDSNTGQQFLVASSVLCYNHSATETLMPTILGLIHYLWLD